MPILSSQIRLPSDVRSSNRSDDQGESGDEFPPVKRWQNWVESMASYAVGQFMLRRLHSMLWTIEKTIKWIETPKTEGPRDDGTLVRPLPWIFFVPTVLMVRFVCFAVYQTSVWRGQTPIDTTAIVASLQWSRRHLRSFRLHGLRAIRLARNNDDTSIIARVGRRLRGIFAKEPTGVDARFARGERTKVIETNDGFCILFNRNYDDNDLLDTTFNADEIESEESTTSYDSVDDSNNESESTPTNHKRRRRGAPLEANGIPNGVHTEDEDHQQPSTSSRNIGIQHQNGDISDEAAATENNSQHENHLEQQIRAVESQRLAGNCVSGTSGIL